MDMGKLMQQAQQMQSRMKEMQEELGQKTVEAESGGGMVKVTMNGRQELLGVKIDPKVVDPAEVELLEDLVLAALQAGHRKAGELAQAEMKQITGGLPLPGMF